MAKIAINLPQLEIKNANGVVWKEIQKRSGAIKKDVNQSRQYWCIGIIINIKEDIMWLYSIFPDAMTVWTAIGAIATFIAVIFALFGDKIKSRIWGAKIKIYHENKLPFNKLAIFEDQKGNKHKGFYIRVKVKNIGRSTVHGVYGKLTKIEYVNKKSAIETYDPSVLRWVGTQKCEPQNLSPKDYDFLDIFFTVENDPNFYINTEYVLRGSPLIFKKDLNPHLLQIAVYSDDAPTVIKEYQLSFDNSNSFESAKIAEV